MIDLEKETKEEKFISQSEILTDKRLIIHPFFLLLE